MNRLKTALQTTTANPCVFSGTPTYTWSYDRWGNGMRQNGSATATVTAPSNRLSGSSYDAAGNVTLDPLGNRYTYDAENRLTTIVNSAGLGGGTSTYQYDADGQRVRRIVNGGAPNEYIYDNAGRHFADMTSSGLTQLAEIYAGGRHLATFNTAAGAMYFIHSDWLGTERARSLYNGTPSETCASLPFGDGLTCSGTDVSPMHFTGKERDTESGLDYFPARYYGSNMGRWMSPDPIPWLGWQHPPEGSSEEEEEESHKKFEDWIGNPQNLNMYAYVNNNPLRYTDPTGMAGCQAGDKKFETCTITITYDKKTSKGTLTVTGMNKGDKGPTELLKTDVVVGGDGHVTPTGTFTASRWEKDHVSKLYGSSADTPWSKTVLGGNAFGPFQLHIKELDGRGIMIHGTMGPGMSPVTWGSSIFLSPTSHGCIRMCNSADINLHNMMPNPSGNKIIIGTTP